MSLPGQPQINEQGQCTLGADGRPNVTGADGDCCCGQTGCPTDCSACPPTYCATFTPITAFLVGLGNSTWSCGTVSATRANANCIWGGFGLGVDCVASVGFGTLRLTISCDGATGEWVAALSVSNLLTIQYRAPASACPPTGTYTLSGVFTSGGTVLGQHPQTIEIFPCDGPPPDPIGACCTPGGGCSDRTQASCAAVAGSVWHGPGSSCATTNCTQPPPTGACCTDAGECTITTQVQCAAIPTGNWLGPNTNCSQCPPVNPPNLVPCCIDGNCIEGFTAAACAAAGGSPVASPSGSCIGVECGPAMAMQTRPAPGLAEAFNWAKAFATAGRVSDSVRREREATCATCEYARQDANGLWCSQCGCGTSDDSRRVFNLASYNEGPMTSLSLPQWGCKHPQRAAGKGWRR